MPAPVTAKTRLRSSPRQEQPGESRALTAHTLPQTDAVVSDARVTGEKPKEQVQRATKTTPSWLITVPENSRQVAEQIANKIHDVSSKAGFSVTEMANYLLRDTPLKGVPHARELKELRNFFRHYLSRDPLAENRLNLGRVVDDCCTLRAPEARQVAVDKLRVLIAEQSFFEARDALSQPFVQVVKDELARQKLIFGALKEFTGNDPTLCPEDHFKTMALGEKRVLRNHPLIGPDIWHSGAAAPSAETLEHPVLSIISPTDRTIKGFSFRFSFFETHCELNERARGTEGSYKVVDPLVSIDERIYNVLVKMIDGKDGGSDMPSGKNSRPVADLATATLKGIRDLSALGGHDTWHHLFYGVGKRYHDPTDRFLFTGSKAFFTDYEFESSLAFSLSEYSFGTLGSFENHAYLSHRAIWSQLISSKTHLADGVIRRFGNFLDDLSELKPALVREVGAEQALGMVQYLAIVAYDQVALLMPHSEILANSTTNRKGETLDQATRRLEAFEYVIDLSFFSRGPGESLNDEQIVGMVLTVLLQKDHAAEFGDVIAEVIGEWFRTPLHAPEQYSDAAPLFALLILLDISPDPRAKAAIISVVREVRQLLKQEAPERSTKALEGVFVEIAQGVLNVPNCKHPDLSLSDRSAHLFLKLANHSLDALHKRFTAAAWILLAKIQIQSHAIMAEVVLSAEHIFRKEVWGRPALKLATDRALDFLVEADSGKLSGLKALVAEEYFFKNGRMPWWDAYADKVDPIARLHTLQRDMAKSTVLETPGWKALKADFLKLVG